ncbi:hypothetical protein BCR32DRAFT_248062 [Anaeromyces robustus]|uniref:Condensation domain-containing protein n=1 Tax=Anaeromyces robustus TaxID=1754192 RepID=A0A1Y1WVS3_9FUNG|nr:hypothetical protein BCR32DRAFT_248062 [Anaeromyces robustus]|eukprot:ORX77296.1 hypothetical protein BCR32DRAFT_248062 [Anaeromyces robustus]
MIGMFVSTQLILLTYKNNESTFIDTIKQNINYLMEMYNNQYISFSELSKLLKLKKVNNSFVYQLILHLTKMEIKKYLIYENSNELNKSNNKKSDISFNAIEIDEEYLISIDYNSKYYECSTINNIINNFIEITKHTSDFN